MKVKKVKFATFEGEITDEREYEEELAPDVKAATLWLNNRHPEYWKDRQAVELTGKDGDPIEFTKTDRQKRIDELLEKRNEPI